MTELNSSLNQTKDNEHIVSGINKECETQAIKNYGNQFTNKQALLVKEEIAQQYGA